MNEQDSSRAGQPEPESNAVDTAEVPAESSTTVDPESERSGSEATAAPGDAEDSSPSGAVTDQALLKRLQSLQRPTWELELLISGAVVFSLFQLPGRMRGWFEGLEPHASSEIGMLPFMAYYFATLIVICLAVAFSLHFVLRSIWVGLTGLRSVFPQGIEWDELDIGPISRSVFREMNPDLRAAEERVDRVSSTIFAVLFAVVVSFLGAFTVIVLPLLLVEVLRVRFFPQVPSMVAFYAVLLLVLMPTLPVGLIDGWFKKDLQRVERYPKLFRRTKKLSRVVQKVFLAQLTSPVILTLSSRFSMKKVTGGMVGAIFLAVALFLSYFVLSANLLGFDSYLFFPQATGSALVRAGHYEDQRDPESASRLPIIQSELIEAGYLRLFVPFSPGRDSDRVQRYCPNLEPRVDGFFIRRRLRPDDDGVGTELLKCVSGIYVVRIDDVPSDVDWAFAQHPTNDLKGLVGYLDLAGLEPGRHELFVARLPDEDESTFSIGLAPSVNEDVEAPPVEDEERFDAELSADAPESNLEEDIEPMAGADAESQLVGWRDRYSIVFWTPREPGRR